MAFFRKKIRDSSNFSDLDLQTNMMMEIIRITPQGSELQVAVMHLPFLCRLLQGNDDADINNVINNVIKLAVENVILNKGYDYLSQAEGEYLVEYVKSELGEMDQNMARGKPISRKENYVVPKRWADTVSKQATSARDL